MRSNSIPAREARLRRALRRDGYRLEKSRLRGEPHIDNLGGYRIIDTSTNWSVTCVRFSLTLEAAEQWAAS